MPCVDGASCLALPFCGDAEGLAATGAGEEDVAFSAEAGADEGGAGEAVALGPTKRTDARNDSG
jgi:hypothetical protein